MSTVRVRPSQAPKTQLTPKTQSEQNKIFEDEIFAGTVKFVKDTYGFVEVDETEEEVLLI